MENNNSQEIIQLMRTYNLNQRMYHLNNLDYNRNINTLLNRIDFPQTNTQYVNPPFRNTFTNNTREFYNNYPNNRTNTDNNLVISLIQQLMHPNNVQIQGLNDEQININTQNIHYTTELNEPRCPITYENFEENEEICQIIHCGHYFKKNAIYRWFQRSTVCPICRHNLSPTINNDLNNSENSINTNIIDPSLNNFFFSMYNDNFSDNLITTSSNNDVSGNRIYNFEFPMYFPPNY